MADLIYNSAKKSITTGVIDLDTDTFYILLTGSSYTPDLKTHVYRSDVTDELAATGGYVTGGFTITGAAVDIDNVLDRVVFDADDWTQALTFSAARWAILYKRRGGAATADDLVRAIDLQTSRSATGSFTLRFGSGIITIIGA